MSAIHRGLRCFGPENEKVILIFIYYFEFWTESGLWEFLNKKYQIVMKLFMELLKNTILIWKTTSSYELIYNKNRDYLKVIYINTKHLPFKRMVWKIASRIHRFNSINYNRTRFYFESGIPISDSLLDINPFSNT